MRWLLITLLTTFTLSAAEPPDAAKARAFYERIVNMAGEWRARSTKGWTESATYTIVGKGSAVLEVSHFIDTPQDAMASVFHLDDGRLMLTHYCEAGNQPRLMATEFGADGRSAVFSFVDGTNMTAHAGHMHRVRIVLVDADHFTSQWTWFSGGKEQWMEEITHERVSATRTRGPR
jgi:hypothetical protein